MKVGPYGFLVLLMGMGETNQRRSLRSRLSRDQEMEWNICPSFYLLAVVLIQFWTLEYFGISVKAIAQRYK